MIGVYNPDDPQHDDFELWSPSEERTEICLFGRQACTSLALTWQHTNQASDPLPSQKAGRELRHRQEDQSGTSVSEELRLL